MTPHLRGTLTAFLAVVVLLPDTILFRMVEADIWTLMTWRGGFQSLALWLGLAVWHRAALPGQVRALGVLGVGFGLIMGVAAVLFNLAIAWTTVANVLYIVATTPLWAALLSRLWLGERLELRVLVTMAVCAVGIGIVAAGEDPGGVAHWSGDLCALGGAIGMATGFTLARMGGERSMVPGLALGAFVPLLAGLVMGGGVVPIAADIWLLAAIGLFIAPVSFALLTLAARSIPSAQVSLMLLLETSLAPILVWLWLGEDPGQSALIGGAIVMMALFASNLWALARR